MKALFLSLFLLVLLAIGALINVAYLDSFTGDLTALLQEAQACTKEGSTQAALRLTQKTKSPRKALARR